MLKHKLIAKRYKYLNISNISPKIDTFVAIKNKRSTRKRMLAMFLDSCWPSGAGLLFYFVGVQRFKGSGFKVIVSSLNCIRAAY